MKLSCIQYERDLAAFVDGELPQARAERVGRHVQACSSCSQVVADLRRINALPPPPVLEPSADFDRLFWTKLASVRRGNEAQTLPGRMRSAARSFFTRPGGLAVSAGLALGVFVVSLYLLRPPRDLLKPEIMAAADLDLYANLELIQNSEALENFELIQVLDELEQDEQG